MTLLASAMEELESVLALEKSSAAQQSHVAFDIDGQGQLHAEVLEDSFLLYSARAIDVGEDRATLMKAALREVHVENAKLPGIQAALWKDDLVFLAHLDEEEIDHQILEVFLDLLFELQNNVRK